jgi:hypothetical protein
MHGACLAVAPTFQRSEDAAMLVEGMRKAGTPEISK